MATYDYKTDGESGEVAATDLADALAKIEPTAAELADGGWAWVQDPTTGERLYAGRENM